MFEVRFPTRSPDTLAPVIGEEGVQRLVEMGAHIRAQLNGRRVVSINSTAAGGGVAEMLPALLAYTSGVGIDSRWLVLEGDPGFFDITKRLHNRVHGEPGDYGPLGQAERDVLISTIRRNEADAMRLLEPGDVILIHDPQPAALAKLLSPAEHPLVWRCHIGADEDNAYTEQAWEFLRPFLEPYIDEYVFTRRAYAPAWVPNERLHVIKPSLDPFSAKNLELDPATVLSTLQHIGILSGNPEQTPYFVRSDGSPGEVTRVAGIVRDGPIPSPDTPMVVQVSRWDPLKDMAGVMEAFVGEPRTSHAHLVLAGPDVSSVTDDPEGQQVLADVIMLWRRLSHDVRSRVSIVCLPMDDPEENATMVNALQRHAAIVVQKSLKEGFGLTVTEAMYKGRPIVASAVGGIVDQIRDEVDGLLVHDPTDLRAAGTAMGVLLRDQIEADRLGRRAKATAVADFLPDTSLSQWAQTLDLTLASAQEREGGRIPNRLRH